MIFRAGISVNEAKKSKNADQQPLGVKPISETQIDAINLYKEVVKSPVVQMPTFSGNILEYAAFKKKFQFIITCTCVPIEFWATHLENSLTGEVKKYLGKRGDWFNSYEELWKFLNSRYANRWFLTNETIRSFFVTPPPALTRHSVSKYFYSQIDTLRGPSTRPNGTESENSKKL